MYAEKEGTLVERLGSNCCSLVRSACTLVLPVVLSDVGGHTIAIFGGALSRFRMMMVSSYEESSLHGSNSSEQRESIAESGKRLSIDSSSEDNLTDIIDFEITTGVSQSVLIPLGAVSLFAVLVLLVVMFRRHPAAVMTMAATSLLAAGAYNIFLFQTSSTALPYRDGSDPQKTPKYE